MFGIGAEAKDSYERVDADSYAQVARALEKRFEFARWPSRCARIRWCC